jgi:DNA-binding CsgD family transcriptional regulator
LLDDTARSAATHRVIHVHGAAGETDLQYAALHLLCSALPLELARLDDHQREALETVVGLRAAPAPDRFLVCVAVVRLLALAAQERPVLCVVDDVQWLDDASIYVLGYVARRLGPVPVGLLFADRGERFTDLPVLVLDRLTHVDARQFLDCALPASFDEAVLERIIAEARGNPQVLLDSVDAASPVELAGGFGVVAAADPEPELVNRLAPQSRLLLILAACEPLGDPVRLWRAAAELGIEATAAEQLEAADLVSFGAWVSFRKPSLRSSIYGLASADERRRAHAALAASTDATHELDRRVWHLGQSLVEPNDVVAGQLADAAGRAQARAGLPATAAFLERAAVCTAHPDLRVERAIMAADAYHAAGAVDAAVRALALAELGSPTGSGRARLLRVQARMSFDASRSRAAVTQLHVAAQELERCQPEHAAPAYLEALAAAVFTGHLEVIQPSLAHLVEHRPGSNDELLQGLAQRCLAGYAAGAEPLKLALKTVDPGCSDDARSRLLACLAAADLWDDETWHDLTQAQLRLARHSGARTVLPYLLTHQALLEVHSGRLTIAESLVEEASLISEVNGTPPLPHANSVLAAWRGQDPLASQTPDQPGSGVTASVARYATAVFSNGHGAYAAAADATRVVLGRDALDLQGWALAELVEGAVRSGDVATAKDASDQLCERAWLSGTDWALGVAAQSRALLETGRTADTLYSEAIQRLKGSRTKAQLARAQLLYGEWLRRQARKVDARVPLRSAYETFVAMGAEAFALRAQRELLAAGDRPHRRTTDSPARLTPQEIRIASLARDGRSNPEIATVLSISPRTVEYHLHKVFAKLSISSRTELHLVLAGR